MTNDNYKLFLRYLKERGLYSSFVRDSKKFPYRRRNVPVKKYMLSDLCTPNGAIMNMITWSGASFEDWGKEYRMYINFYSELIRKKGDKYELFEGIEKVSE